MGKSLCLKFVACVSFCALVLFLSSCGEEGSVISKPDEATHVFESGEKILLKAIAQVLKDKDFGGIVINYGNNLVESDYTIQDEWRTKGIARVKKLNQKECEVVLSVITEKKTGTGWELRRLLEKRQYDSFFDLIETQIYRELYKAQ